MVAQNSHVNTQNSHDTTTNFHNAAQNFKAFHNIVLTWGLLAATYAKSIFFSTTFLANWTEKCIFKQQKAEIHDFHKATAD